MNDAPKTMALYQKWDAMTDTKMASKALDLCERLERELTKLKINSNEGGGK